MLKSFNEANETYKSNLADLKSKEVKFINKIEESKNIIHGISSELILAEEAKKAIKMFLSYSFDDALESIGSRATEIICCIPNMSNATIQFDGTKETKDGKVKEEVNAVIGMDGEESVPIKSLSGGGALRSLYGGGGGKTIGGNLLVEAGSMIAAQTPLKPGDYVADVSVLMGFRRHHGDLHNLTLGVIAQNGLMSSWGFQLPKREFKAGEELKGTVLFVRGSYPELPNNALAETIRTTMGFAGKPAYSLDPRIGKIVGSRYRVRAEARDGIWAAVIGKADLPLLLPVEVGGLNDRWEAFRYDRRTKIMRPVPVCEGVGYASVDLSDGADIVIGHPVISTAPELRLNIFQTGNQWSVVVHNPTDKPIETTLTGSPEFPAVARLAKTVSIPAMSSISIPVP